MKPKYLNQEMNETPESSFIGEQTNDTTFLVSFSDDHLNIPQGSSTPTKHGRHCENSVFYESKSDFKEKLIDLLSKNLVNVLSVFEGAVSKNYDDINIDFEDSNIYNVEKDHLLLRKHSHSGVINDKLRGDALVEISNASIVQKSKHDETKEDDLKIVKIQKKIDSPCSYELLSKAKNNFSDLYSSSDSSPPDFLSPFSSRFQGALRSEISPFLRKLKKLNENIISVLISILLCGRIDRRIDSNICWSELRKLCISNTVLSYSDLDFPQFINIFGMQITEILKTFATFRNDINVSPGNHAHRNTSHDEPSTSNRSQGLINNELQILRSQNKSLSEKAEKCQKQLRLVEKLLVAFRENEDTSRIQLKNLLKDNRHLKKELKTTKMEISDVKKVIDNEKLKFKEEFEIKLVYHRQLMSLANSEKVRMKEEIIKLQSRIKSLEQTEVKLEALKVNSDSVNLKVIDFQKKMVHIKNQLSSMARARFESTNQKDKRILELLGELESSLYTQFHPTSQYKESNATVANEIDEHRTSLSNKLLYENKGLYHKLKEFKKTITCKEANFKNTIMVLENENRELKYNIYRLTNTSVDNKPGFCSKSKIKGGSKDLLEDSNAYKYSINSDVLLTDDSPEQLNECTLNKRRKIINKKV